MESRLIKINNRIEETTKLKNIFTVIGNSSIIVGIIVIMLYSCLNEKSSTVAFSLILIICIVLFGVYIFSNVVISHCEKLIEKDKVDRTVIISRMESARIKFEIANAFAHCYWNALDNPNDKRLELDFSSEK